MIESFSDYIASGALIGLVIVALIMIARVFLTHRKQKLIEEEIEYYQDW